MHQKHASLRLRLALLFALASAVLFALMGFYVFNALEREVAYRDDMALLGRIDRIENIIKDNSNIDLLKNSQSFIPICSAIKTMLYGLLMKQVMY